MRDFDTVYIRRESASSEVVNLVRDFDIFLTKVEEGEVSIKEPFHTSWLDEDGDDVYVGDKIYRERCNFTLSLASRDGGREKMDNLIRYLTRTDGCSFLFYVPYLHKGFGNCLLNKVMDVSTFNGSDSVDIVEFSLEICCYRPSRAVILVVDEDGNASLT